MNLHIFPGPSNFNFWFQNFAFGCENSEIYFQKMVENCWGDNNCLRYERKIFLRLQQVTC